MAASFQLVVLTAEGEDLEIQAVSLVARAWEGYVGVLAGHAPMITALKPGVMKVTDDNDSTKYLAVGGGVLEVNHDNVSVLADIVLGADSEDDAKAKAATF
jgi:F-type H+-transporting ATPase subunit epsilon